MVLFEYLAHKFDFLDFGEVELLALFVAGVCQVTLLNSAFLICRLHIFLNLLMSQTEN